MRMSLTFCDGFPARSMVWPKSVVLLPGALFRMKLPMDVNGELGPWDENIWI